MKANEGRLQTAEHIFAKILEEGFGVRVVIADFKEESGRLEVNCAEDLRNIDLKEFERDVNEVIEKDLVVIKKVISRGEAVDFDLSRILSDVDNIRIVEIIGFDARPCRDPHVDNTSEIGQFKILNCERKGRDRYKFEFIVK